MRNTDSTFTDGTYKETHGSVLSARHLKINSDIGDIDIDDIAPTKIFTCVTLLTLKIRY